MPLVAKPSFVLSIDEKAASISGVPIPSEPIQEKEKPQRPRIIIAKRVKPAESSELHHYFSYFPKIRPTHQKTERLHITVTLNHSGASPLTAHRRNVKEPLTHRGKRSAQPTIHSPTMKLNVSGQATPRDKINISLGTIYRISTPRKMPGYLSHDKHSLPTVH
jgi:hypothetical protein